MDKTIHEDQNYCHDALVIMDSGFQCSTLCEKYMVMPGCSIGGEKQVKEREKGK